jgi:hypothetical protein
MPCASLTAIRTAPAAATTTAAATAAAATAAAASACGVRRRTRASPTIAVATKMVAAELPPPGAANA